MYKFELGDKVKHREIGFVGIVMGRVEYLSGTKKYGIKVETIPDNFIIGTTWRWLKGDYLQLHGRD